ncbi:hypothetical protein OAF82_00595 [bacterium]|nr:hypothetical protein [bacterium]
MACYTKFNPKLLPDGMSFEYEGGKEPVRLTIEGPALAGTYADIDELLKKAIRHATEGDMDVVIQRPSVMEHRAFKTYLDSDALVIQSDGTFTTYDFDELDEDMALSLLWHYRTIRMASVDAPAPVRDNENMTIRTAIEREIKRRDLSTYEVAKHLVEAGVCSQATAYRFLEDGRSPKLEVLDELIKWLDLKVVRK